MQLSYFGKNFHGWQVQPNATSVQQALNEAFSVVFNEEVYCVGAGRTDTGVHAREMWAHFDVQKALPQNAVHRINSFIGKDIAIRQFVSVDDKAHARFDALSRSYEYHITTVKDPFLQDTAWFFPWKLDVSRMEQAAKLLFEYEDFSCFSKSNTQTMTNLCTIENAGFEVAGDQIIFHITANRFLRNMVRAIVGTLVEIGQGKRPIEDMHKIIEAKDRRLAGESAPAHGLYLTRVLYLQEVFNG